MSKSLFFASRPDRPAEPPRQGEAAVEDPQVEAAQAEEQRPDEQARESTPSLDDLFHVPRLEGEELRRRIFQREPESWRPPPAPRPAPPRPAPVAPARPAPVAPARPAPVAPAPRERTRNWRGVAVGLAGVLVLAAAGVLLALALRGDDPKVVSAPGLAEVTVPDDWVDQRVVLPDFDGPDARTVAPPDGLYTSALMIGGVRPSPSSLLPTDVLRSLAQPPPRPAIRELSGGWVFSYRGMRLREPAGRLTMHVMLTASGTAAVGCFAGRLDPTAFARRCDAAAESLRPAPGVRAHRGLSREYARALDTTFAALNESRAAARGTLKRASTPGRVRAVERGLQRDFARAAATLRGSGALRGRPELSAANERIASALGRTAAAYGASDRRIVLSRERDLRRALRDLAGLGYRPRLQ